MDGGLLKREGGISMALLLLGVIVLTFIWGRRTL